MRVMQIIYSFMVGGSEMVALNLCLNGKNSLIHSVASLEMTGPLRDHFSDQNINTFVIDRKPNEKIGPMFRLWKIMQTFKPDIVHTHHYYQLFYAWPGALLVGAKIIHTEHEYYSLINNKVKIGLKSISHICSYVTGVNDETSLYLKNIVGISKSKVYTINNGIDLRCFEKKITSCDCFGLVKEDFVIGIIARLHPVKDHVTLLHAFSLLLSNYSQAKLLIIGDGDDRPKLESLVLELNMHDRVQFLGIRTNIPEILCCLDVVVLSSREEGLPLCILEGMAASKPVVATAVGGIPSVVMPGVNGLLVPPGDPTAMAAALLQLAQNPSTRKEMGENGRRLVEQRYDMRNSANAYFELYQAAVS